MRYRDTGELHKDFHLATDRTVSYVMEHYGEEFLRELCRRTSQDIYQDIYGHLKLGDLSALAEHWEYYYTREQGQFTLTWDDDVLELHVSRCPAAEHIIEKAGKLSSHYYLFAGLLVEYWCEGTPFAWSFEVEGDMSYRAVVRRKHAAQ